MQNKGRALDLFLVCGNHSHCHSSASPATKQTSFPSARKCPVCTSAWSDVSWTFCKNICLYSSMAINVSILKQQLVAILIYQRFALQVLQDLPVRLEAICCTLMTTSRHVYHNLPYSYLLAWDMCSKTTCKDGFVFIMSLSLLHCSLSLCSSL